MPPYLNLFLGLMCLAVIVECENCIHNLGIVEITTTSITVRWDYDCPMEDIRVSVRYRHLEHMGCKNLTNYSKDRQSVGEVQVKNKTHVTLQHLNIFSKYFVQVKDLSSKDDSSNGSIIVTTRSTAPQVSPDDSMTQFDYKTTSTHLNFNWRAPPRSSCSLFHGKVSGYFYQLAGVDKWNKHIRKSGDVLGFQNTNIQFNDLVPFSHYVMHIYLTLEGGRYNPDQYLKMEKSTKASHPNKPRQVEVVSAYKQSFHLMWKPPYPPTGRISSYTIRWKEPDAPHWMDSQTVPPKSALCRDDINSNNICHNINGLPGDKYIFQVQATNLGVKQVSMWEQVIWDKDEMNKQLNINVNQNNKNDSSEDNTQRSVFITQVDKGTKTNIITVIKDVPTETKFITTAKDVTVDITTSHSETVTASNDVASVKKYIGNNTDRRQPRILTKNNITLFTLIKHSKDENNTEQEINAPSEKDRMLSLSKSIISMQTVFIVVVSFMISILLLLLIYVSLRCRTKGKESPTSRQSSMRTYSTTAGSQCSDTETYRSGRTREFVHLSRRYTQDPLPPVPDEHIYSDLKPTKEKTDNDIEEFIYLPPKPALVDERGEGDDDEYLKTNFHTYKRLDTTASPIREMDPPIPIRSYESNDVFGSKLNLNEHLCTIT